MKNLNVDIDGNVILSDGNLSLVENNNAIIQRLWRRLRRIKGEWFLNKDVGLDYFGLVLKKNYVIAQIRREFQRVALGTQGIKEVYNFTHSFDTADKNLLLISFDVMTENNNLFTVSGNDVLRTSSNFDLSIVGTNA